MKVAAGVIIGTGPEVLLVRNRLRGWENPGGKARRGEQPISCAQREMREETGLQPLGFTAHHWTDYHGDFEYHTFVCTAWLGYPRKRGLELAEVRWFQWPEAVDIVGDWLKVRMRRIGNELGQL